MLFFDLQRRSDRHQNADGAAVQEKAVQTGMENHAEPAAAVGEKPTVRCFHTDLWRGMPPYVRSKPTEFLIRRWMLRVWKRLTPKRTYAPVQEQCHTHKESGTV